MSAEENSNVNEEKKIIDIETEPENKGNAEEKTGEAENEQPLKEAKQKIGDKIQKTKKWFGKAIAGIGSFLGSVKFDPLFFVKFLDKLLGLARKTFSTNMFHAMSEWSVRYGHVALITGAALSILCFLFAGIRAGSFLLFLSGIGYAFLLLVLQYTVNKFIDSGDSLVKSSPSRLASANFLDCVAILMELTGVVLFILFALQGWIQAIVGIGAWAFFDVVAWTALHPSLCNITISKETNAGEEAIGILSFAVKAAVRIVPLGFGLGTIIGAIALVLATVKMLFAGGAGEAAVDAIGLIIVASCLPFVSYLLFAVYHLTVDVLRSILSVPGKLDSLGKKD
ncbi:MAG: hypothetical protein ACOC6C_04165 [Verrucomicrobiota bacterium]